MTQDTTIHDGHGRALRVWLYCVAALVFALVLVGGATRLTESGLSIVEWKPVLGALPPLNDTDWQSEFAKYQAIPQYRQLNAGMSLAEFKTIYWWEWTHRLLGRVVGAAFLFPFLWFLLRGMIGAGLRRRLWGIFALGAAQGAVGWWMVSSGLADRVSVSQYRLAFHLTLACVIYASILWSARRLRPHRDTLPVPARLTLGAMALLVLLLIQIYLGALVAGLDAGQIYNTWPLIDGALIPDAARLFHDMPLWRNFFENQLTVQFVHRMSAYVLWTLAVLHAADVALVVRRGPALDGALLLASAVTIQAALGVLTLLYVTPLALALAHQGFAVVVLTVAVIHAERLATPSRSPAWAAERGSLPASR